MKNFFCQRRAFIYLFLLQVWLTTLLAPQALPAVKWEIDIPHYNCPEGFNYAAHADLRTVKKCAHYMAVMHCFYFSFNKNTRNCHCCGPLDRPNPWMYDKDQNTNVYMRILACDHDIDCKHIDDHHYCDSEGLCQDYRHTCKRNTRTQKGICGLHDGGCRTNDDCEGNLICKHTSRIMGKKMQDWNIFHKDVKAPFYSSICRAPEPCKCASMWQDQDYHPDCTWTTGCPKHACESRLERRWCIIGNPHCDDQNELIIFNKNELRMYCDEKTPVTNKKDFCWNDIDKIRCKSQPKPKPKHGLKPKQKPEIIGSYHKEAASMKKRIFTWVLGESEVCSKSCGGGIKEKIIYCVNNKGEKVDNMNCPQKLKPVTTIRCNLDPCEDPCSCALHWSDPSEGDGNCLNQSGCPEIPCDDPTGDRWCITIDPVACAAVDGEDDLIFCDDTFPVSNICHPRTNRKKVDCVEPKSLEIEDAKENEREMFASEEGETENTGIRIDDRDPMELYEANRVYNPKNQPPIMTKYDYLEGHEHDGTLVEEVQEFFGENLIFLSVTLLIGTIGFCLLYHEKL